jgi:hypothetical protein
MNELWEYKQQGCTKDEANQKGINPPENHTESFLALKARGFHHTARDAEFFPNLLKGVSFSA